MAFEGFPFVIGWELTLACNLRCRHCATSAGEARGQELTLDEALAICGQMPALLVREVIFTGGEPLLNPNWPAIASRLRQLGVRPGVVTNGLTITEAVVSRMMDCGLKAAGVSIDGPEYVHDKLRGLPGAFRKTLKGIECMAKAGVEVSVITSVTNLNIDLLDEVYKLVRLLGAWKWQLQPLFPLGRGAGEAVLRLREDDFLKLGRYIRDLNNRSNGHRPKVVPADSCGYFSELDSEEFGWRGCPAGRYECGIMSDGRVKGCLSWPDSTVEGDLRKEDLWAIWFRPGAFAYNRNFTAEEMAGSCRNCERAAECGGGCQAMSLAATGTYHADPYCYKRLLALERGTS